MTIFVRKMDHKKWFPSQELAWVSPDDIEADPVGDLATDKNTLSVFLVKNEDAAKRAVIAVSARWDDNENVAYVMFYPDDLARFGLKVAKVNGNTKDEGVNSWHWNIVDLSANAIIKLAKFFKATRPKKLFFEELVDLYAVSVENNYLRLKDIRNDETRNAVKQKIEG